MSAHVIKSGPYSGYQVVIGDDFPRLAYYDEAAGSGVLIRVHYRVSRMPSTRTFKLRHLSGSTGEDRENALARLDHIGAAFRKWEQLDAVHRVRFKDDPSKWLFYAFAGTRVSDPLVQLELEMMIDLAQSARASL